MQGEASPFISVRSQIVTSNTGRGGRRYASAQRLQVASVPPCVVAHLPVAAITPQTLKVPHRALLERLRRANRSEFWSWSSLLRAGALFELRAPEKRNEQLLDLAERIAPRQPILLATSLEVLSRSEEDQDWTCLLSGFSVGGIDFNRNPSMSIDGSGSLAYFVRMELWGRSLPVAGGH